MHETHSTVTTLGITKLVKTRESINFESDSSNKESDNRYQNKSYECSLNIKSKNKYSHAKYGLSENNISSFLF